MSQAGLLNAASSNPAIPTSFVTDAGTAIPVANVLNVNGGANVNTSASGNQIVINSTGGTSFTWQTITASQTLAVNNGYICISAGGALSLALPTTAAVGSIIEVTLDGATSWTITQGVGQQIRMGKQQTTSGATGTLASNFQGDGIRMVCSVANNKFNILSLIGDISFV